MRTSRPPGVRHRAHVLFGILLLLGPGSVLAGDYDGKDLSLRIPATISRFASYGDVAGVGGASAGSKWSSSMNPASAAWRRIPGDIHLSVSPQYSAIHFDEGGTWHVITEAVTWDAGRLGTFQPGMAQLRSGSHRTRQGYDLEMDLDYAQFQWGRHWGEKWALGGGINFASSETTASFGSTTISRSRGESYGFRIGALHQPVEKLLAGLVLDYAVSPSRTRMYDFMGLGIGTTTEKDTTHQFLVRPGVSYEYAKDSAVYVDYQFGTFFNHTGHLTANRLYLGVDHRIVDWLFVRGGTALDLRGNAAWTAGLGVYPCDRLSIDVAFQRDMFPELAPEFGRSWTFTLSVSIAF